MTAPAATPIYEGQDFYVPSFEVKIGGRPPGQDVIRDILTVSYKDNIQEIDGFDLTINNWDAETLGFKYSDSQLFDPGKEVELWMGYRGGRDGLRLMLKGQITSLRPSFPAGGGSTLTVSGVNVLQKLRTKQESHIYENLTDTEIAQQIGARLSLKFDPKPAPDERPYKYLIQDNQFDIIFLMERARRVGYDLTVEERASNGTATETVLLFGPSVGQRKTAYRLSYGKSLIEFSPELTTANQVGKVTVRGWDAVRKAKIEKTVTRNDIATKGVGQRGGQDEIDKSIDQKVEVVATKPVESEEEALTLATQILEGIAKEMVKGTGSVPGLPDLRSGAVLEMDGLGDRFSGRYFVISTTHTIGDSGYTTQFECRREEI